MSLVEAVCRLTTRFPDNGRFGLVSEMRRAAISIPSNISEGAAGRSTSEYLRCPSMALGSLAELDTQIQITNRLELSTPSTELGDLLQRTFARLNALILAIEKRRNDARSTEFPIPNPQSRPSHAR